MIQTASTFQSVVLVSVLFCSLSARAGQGRRFRDRRARHDKAS